MALTIADLNNAKEDVDTIAAVANSEDPTTETRLGDTIRTLSGLIEEIETIAGLSEETAAVAAIAGLLVDNVDSIVTVAGDVVHIDRVAEYTTEIGIVAAGLSDVATLAAQIEELGAVDNALSLLGEHPQGLAIDLTTSDINGAVKVIDATTPANNFTGSMYDFLSKTATWTPKLCLQQDGSLKFSPHNNIIQSADPSNASWTKLNVTPTIGQVGPDGATTDGTLLAVSGSTTTPRIQQQPAVLAGRYRRLELVVKAGTAPFVYLEITNNAVTKRAWLNTSTLAWGTVDAGLVTTLSATKEDGTAWATGWRSIAIHDIAASTSDTLRIGLSDTDGGTTCTLGRTATIARIQWHYGVKRLPYLATTAAAVRSTPYDWTPGYRAVRADPATTYQGRDSNNWTTGSWTAANITPVLNAVGPAGEPCTTLTATAADGTISQAVTSTGIVHITWCWARRKTGTGAVSISADNGASYTDVTSQLGVAGGAYKPIYIKSVLANPTFKLKIATSGDAIEVALFNQAQLNHLPAPYPSVGADVAASADAPNIASTLFPNNAAGMTFYADLWMPQDAYNTPTISSRVGFHTGSTAKSAIVFRTRASDIRLEHTTDDGTGRVRNFGDAHVGRLQIQHRFKPNDYAIAYNGNASWWDADVGTVTYDGFRIVQGQSVWIRRLLIVPEAVSDDGDALRTFNLDATDANVNINMLATAFVSKGVQGSTGILRIPTLVKLFESGDVCRFMTVWGQRYTVGYNLEAPQRMMGRTWEFNRSTDVLAPLEAERVILQTAGWNTGVAGTSWGVQGYNLLKITKGKWRGRLVAQFEQQDQPGGTPDNRNLYLMTSDDNGYTWTAPVKILDIATFGLASGFVINGENSTFVQMDSGPYTGRVYASFNMNNQQMGVMWTDDFTDAGNGTGATWSVTPANGGAGVGRVLNTGYAFGTLTEPAVALRPDNSIVLFFRNSGGGDVAWSLSTDYGQNFSVPVLCAGDAVAHNVNAGFIQTDPTGKLGKYGRFLIARSTGAGRVGHKIQQSTDAAMTLVTVLRLLSPERFVGYCPLLQLFENDNKFAIMPEYQPTVSSNVNTVQGLAVFEV